jgi:hypothetical protein
MKPDSRPVETQLPPLSDEAAVAVHDCLTEFLLAFESRYFAQIHRFYGEQFANNLVQPGPFDRLQDDVPPF